MKKFILASFILATCAFATKIACVGNSITEGYGIYGSKTYPQNLQELLGLDYTVENFGVSSKMFARKGDDESYWKMEKFTKALAFEPDIVVIELGTNDSKFFMENDQAAGVYNYYYGNYEKQKLYGDYEALIDTFATLKSNPRIFATLQPYSNNKGWFITDTVIANVINPIILESAIKKGVNIIDLHSQFKTPSWFLEDSVHPNANGAVELAKLIQKYVILDKPEILQNGSELSVNKGVAYKWYKDGAPLENASAQSLDISQNGTYKVLVKIDESDSWLVSNELVVTDLNASSGESPSERPGEESSSSSGFGESSSSEGSSSSNESGDSSSSSDSGESSSSSGSGDSGDNGASAASSSSGLGEPSSSDENAILAKRLANSISIKKGIATIQLESATALRIEQFDMQGRVIFSMERIARAGANEIALKPWNKATILRVQVGDQSAIFKVAPQR